MEYIVKNSVIINNGEGADPNDILEIQGIQNISNDDFFLLPQFNYSNFNTHGYPYLDGYVANTIFTEGVQPTAQSWSDGYGITNKAGTLYFLHAVTPTADGYTPSSVSVVNVQEDSLLFNSSYFTPDLSNPRYALVGLKLSTSISTVTRDMEDAATSVITSQTVNKYNNYVIDGYVALGTPSGSPTIPTLPAGYLPWCLVKINANQLAGFINGNSVIPLSVPRGLSKCFAGPFDGNSSATTADTKSVWIPGVNFLSDIATSSTGTAGWQMISGHYIQNNGATGVASVGLSIPSTATLNSLTLYYYKDSAGSTTAITSSISSTGTITPLTGGGGSLTSTAGNLTNTFTLATPFSPTSTLGLIFVYTQSTAATHERIYGLVLNYSDGYTRYAGFTADYINNLLIANNTTTSYIIPITAAGTNKKLEKIKIFSSVNATGQFSIGAQTGSSAISSYIVTSDMDALLESDHITYNFLSAVTLHGNGLWTNNTLSPFNGLDFHYFLIWTPTTIGDTFYGAEFILAGS